MDISFRLNGEDVTLSGADPTRSVLDFLRDDKGLTGTKEGCNEGDCGACTVMIRDAGGTRAVNACIQMLGHLQGKSVTTIEGLATPDAPHPVQTALIEEHGSQCGFCTPGIAMSLAAGQVIGDRDFATQLAGNLCRCTGYAPILRAAERAADAAVPDHLRPGSEGASPDASGEMDPALPGSVEALAHALMERPHATVVAGATDVALWLTKQLRELPDVIFLQNVRELQEIHETPDGLRIGAGVSIETLRRLLAPTQPHFAEMLRRFASTQVRNTATLGGNIANGSPIGDTPPPLIALGVTLHLRRGDARRVIPLQDFFIDYGKQDRQPGEFVEAVTLPKAPPVKVYKLSKRFDQDISAVLGAFDIRTKDGKVQAARIAFGGMAGIPKRATHVEQALIGQPWTRGSVDAALTAFSADFTPLDDIRASASYRLQAAQNMLVRAFLEDQGQVASLHEVTP